MKIDLVDLAVCSLLLIIGHETVSHDGKIANAIVFDLVLGFFWLIYRAERKEP